MKNWLNEFQFVSDRINSLLDFELFLTDYNPSKILMLPEASNLRIGSVISHIFFPDRSEKAKDHGSRSLKPVEFY